MSDHELTLDGNGGPITIARDRDGVPQIHAAVVDDALFGLGYCHARDRGLQMLLVRTLARGEASAKLKATADMLALDRFFRRMNFGHDAEAELARLSPRARDGQEAYCRGVNAYFDEAGEPWEFRLVGDRLRGAPWSFADIYLTAKVIGYVALAQSQAEVEHWIVEAVQAGLARELLEALFPGRLGGLDEALLRRVKLGDRIVPAALSWTPALPSAAASNNWAVAGSKTASGMPILCSDPHLEINRLPAVWYEAVLRWDGRDGAAPRYAMGATMPGIPGVVIGRNNDVAWGVTYACMDCVDSWVEDCRDGKYRREDGWHSFTHRHETIHRRGKDPVEATFFENEHGTLEGDPNVPGLYLATRWSCGEGVGAAATEGLLGMLEATTVDEGAGLLGTIANSSWNWVLADRGGHIGYQMAGRMPIRREGTTGLVPLPGWDPANDWKGFAPAEDLPRQFDPPEGYIATANDDLNALGKRKPINVSSGPYRAQRIREVLARGEALSVENMERLQFDLHSRQAERFLALLRPILVESDDEAARVLAGWDGSYDDVEASRLFERFYRSLIDEVFGAGSEGHPGALGGAVVAHLMDRTPFLAEMYWNVDQILLAERSPWFGGRSRAQVYRAALAKALRHEHGHVQDVHDRGTKVVLRHILFGGMLPIRLGFDRGPIVLKGGRATVHQAQVYHNKGREVAFAPSYRFVADLATDDAHTTLPGGPSDRRFSKWYARGLLDWLHGRFRTLHGLPREPEADEAE